MKAIFIVFNQSHTERVEYLLDKSGVKGYTWWSDVKGRGSDTGEPRFGTHTWPEMNSAVLCIIEDDLVEKVLDCVKKLDTINKEIGIRAFVWNITGGY